MEIWCWCSLVRRVCVFVCFWPNEITLIDMMVAFNQNDEFHFIVDVDVRCVGELFW